MSKKSSLYLKSYALNHKANPVKLDSLFKIYSVYQKEYKILTKDYWHKFTHNQVKNNKFSYLGSTKHITTSLNASYLQGCLAQVCATLNKHLDSLEKKFSLFLSKSSIKNPDLLHQLRTINLQHSWLKPISFYYPVYERYVVDDYGNLLIFKEKRETLISNEVKRLAKYIIKHIMKKRVKFPDLRKPRLLLDSRVYSLEKTKKLNPQGKATFDYWLKITTMDKGKRISIPIQSNDYFRQAQGKLGGTIELNFNHLGYDKMVHHHQSLIKPKFNRNKNKKLNGLKARGLAKVNRTLQFTFNKQQTLEQLTETILNKAQGNNLNKDNSTQSIKVDSKLIKVVGFDLGLCNLIATSEGQLLGNYWLDKLKVYDKKIQTLASARQSLGLKTRSKRYDNLIAQVKGFIKTEINRILNLYFKQNSGIKTIVIESLSFNKPELSRKLNRIIKNFGQQIFKSKLSDLSLIYGFEVKEINPAYSSQECSRCGYVDTKNRATQSVFKCLCCQTKLNADIQGARVIEKRFLNSNKDNVTNYGKTLYKGIVLRRLKQNFVKEIETLTSDGLVGRRYLYNLLSKNHYFSRDIKDIVNTTEGQGLAPITAYNFDNYLTDDYSELK